MQLIIPFAFLTMRVDKVNKIQNLVRKESRQFFEQSNGEHTVHLRTVQENLMIAKPMEVRFWCARGAPLIKIAKLQLVDFSRKVIYRKPERGKLPPSLNNHRVKKICNHN